MSEKDDKPRLILVTDPAEIERLKSMEPIHERSLEDAGKEIRANRAFAKIAAKAASGAPFNIVWHKIEAIHEDATSLLRGHICESVDKEGKHFSLSVLVDYRKLYQLNPAKQDVLAEKGSPTAIEFNQHRATTFEAGSFDSYEAAKSHMRLMDQYLMHVLAEAGAEKSILTVNDGTVALEDSEQAADQNFSQALRTARLVEAFRANIVDASDVSFRDTVGIILHAITEELGLPYERTEKEELGRINVRCAFEREIGDFTFIDRGRDNPAHMTHEIRNSQTRMRSLKFEGTLTTGALQNRLIDWLAGAARERGTISDEAFAKLHGQIMEIRGVPLRTTKLGLFSPFQTAENGKPTFTMN